MKSKSYGKDKISMLMIALFFAVTFVYSGKYPKDIVLYPKLICELGIGLSVLEVLKICLLERKEKAYEQIASVSVKDLIKVLIVFAGLVVYAVMIPFLGYVVSTILYMAAVSFWINRTQKKYTYLVIAVCMAIVLYVVFKIVLKIPLPAGILI